MKQSTNFKKIVCSFLLVVCKIGGFAQTQVAISGFNFYYANPAVFGFDPVKIKSSQGTVCDNGFALTYNYYDYYNKQVAPGVVSWNDSSGIENAAANTPVKYRFKATAGKPVTLTLDLYLGAPSGNSSDGFYVNDIGGNVEGRIGTLARSTENGHNNLYDDQVNFTKTAGPENNGFSNHFTFTASFKFKRGSTAGYVFITVPVKNYDGQTRYEEFIVPYLVAGPLDEQVKQLGYTSEPRIPYMVLHDPPGDGSTATLSTTTQSCRSMEESYSTDISNNVFGTVKLGLKGSIGFVATIDYEIFAEFSAGATIGDVKIGSTSTETCISVSHDVTTSALNPDANTSDLFIGYGMDMWYAVADNLAFDGCSYKISKNLIYSPKDGTTTDFVYTKQDILDDMVRQQASLSTPGFTQRDSAKVIYQINIWKQVLALNDSNINHPNETSPVTKNFSFGSSQSYSKTVDINQANTIAVEHYIDVEAGLQGVVNIGGSGFSAGYKFTTSKKFGNSSTSTSSTSQTINYSLFDDDPGDAFSVRIVTDPMYGTPVFQLLPGTKSSCPYEGGIQRDQPKLSLVGTTDSAVTYPNVPVGEYQSFYLRICNDAAESRSYRLRLKNNNNNAVVTAGGNAGPEFNAVTGISLGPKNATDACTTYQVDVHQLNPNSLSFPDLEFELYDLCDDGVSSSVFATINYGTLVKSISNGNWNDISVWQARRVPQPTDNVTIDSTHVISIPGGLNLQCKNLTLNPNAQLIIPANSKLTLKAN